MMANGMTFHFGTVLAKDDMKIPPFLLLIPPSWFQTIHKRKGFHKLTRQPVEPPLTIILRLFRV